jgi:predicted membrane channel-forming protein YqfA (hemolysin III family)
MPAPLPSLQVRQELANILTHGVGILFGIVAIPILIALATNSGQIAGLVGRRHLLPYVAVLYAMAGGGGQLR